MSSELWRPNARLLACAGERRESDELKLECEGVKPGPQRAQVSRIPGLIFLEWVRDGIFFVRKRERVRFWPIASDNATRHNFVHSISVSNWSEKNRLIFFVAERETSKVSFRIPKLQRTSVKEICFLATGANVETIKWQKVLKTKPSTMTTSWMRVTSTSFSTITMSDVYRAVTSKYLTTKVTPTLH